MRAFTLALVAIIAVPTAALAQTAPAPSAPPAAAAPAPQRQGMPDNPEAKARFEKFRAACGADLKTFCATVERGTEQGRGEMRQCVEANKAKFSATCLNALAERDANREARKQGQAAPVAPASADKPKT
jgi:hypothetical protein